MEMAIRLRTHFWGVCVGEDSLGNRYYRDRHFGFGTRAGEKERRWVVYRHETEASMVTAAWHGWLHHTSDDIPNDMVHHPYDWMREHQPNQTGTARAWHRQGSLHDRHRRAHATGDYQPWMGGESP